MHRGRRVLQLLAVEQFEPVGMHRGPDECVHLNADGRLTLFGETRLRAAPVGDRETPVGEVSARAVRMLAEWAGSRRFADDVSIIALEWLGV